MTLPIAFIELALALAILGGVAAAATIGEKAWKYSRRFRPQFEVRIDSKSQAIKVDVTNKGRLEGRITEMAAVTVVDQEMLELPSEFAGLEEGRFHPAQLAGGEGRRLIVQAVRASGPFPDDVRILVRWGKDGEDLCQPEKTSDVSYYGMKSNWPSG